MMDRVPETLVEARDDAMLGSLRLGGLPVWSSYAPEASRARVFRRSTKRLLSILLIGVAVSYCNDTFGPEGLPPTNLVPQRNTKIVEITTPDLYFLELHRYKEIRAAIRDLVSGEEVDGEITWTSSDPQVVRAPTRCGGQSDLSFPCARPVGEGQADLIASHTEGSVTVSDTVSAKVRVARRIRIKGRTDWFFNEVGASFQIEWEVQDGRRRVIEGRSDYVGELQIHRWPL